ncbi:hypothetical protein WI460_02515 [Gemmatimonadota bacterium Y43]|uniref:hypothetical protein n=1 Tax=Gaopeijia maritima TaxID=3119007 RepID=UPI0032776F47
MTMGRTLAWFCATAFLAAGCESADAPPGFEVVDSAGVRIVINDRSDPDAGGRIVVEQEPTLSIGTLDGSEEEQLFRVTDATRLPDGRIAVLNVGSGEVRFYGADGRHLRSVGAPGDGPGEFRNPFWIARRADTLVIFDPFQDNGRATTLDLNGDLIATYRLSTEAHRFPNPSTLLADGTFLDAMGEGSIGDTETGHVRFTHIPVRYPRTGSAIDTIAVVPGSELYRAAEATFVVQTPVPFGREAFTTAGPVLIYTGNGEEAAVEAFDLSGSHRLSIRFPEERDAVTPELVARWIDAQLADAPFAGRPDEAERVQQARERYAAPPVPATMPAHGELLVDEDQRLWVRRYAPPWEPGNEWMVFDADGVWIGDAAMPPELRVFEIGRDWVLGVVQDELSVEYLRMHRWSIH